ncbi:MAG: hypothetical protein ICV55_15165, partial [Coleofasciculus sp. C3-bin4]|nr:hypothetical protein [Coleofasciculus sp. C3-bin4]
MATNDELTNNDYRPTFLVGAMLKSAPGLPGTAPLISNKLRSASTLITSSLRMVTRVPPKRPAILLPG